MVMPVSSSIVPVASQSWLIGLVQFGARAEFAALRIIEAALRLDDVKAADLALFELADGDADSFLVEAACLARGLEPLPQRLNAAKHRVHIDAHGLLDLFDFNERLFLKPVIARSCARLWTLPSGIENCTPTDHSGA
jgi:hypothetical protein